MSGCRATGASSTPRSADARCVAVAYSGGRDSTALLHATLHAAAPLGIRVAALHVHHGLNRQADAWLEHCRRCCAQWVEDGLPVSFAAHRLVGSPAPGESVEAWARDGRYRALAEMAHAHGASLVLLAHHRRDQAETVLLQALRGAGPRGLSAMPRCVERDGLRWARPWLDRPREEIEAYVARHGLDHVEDDSNHQPRHARNRLRLAVWPDLLEAFPQAEAALADAARRAQEAARCMEDLAAIDLAPMADERGLELGAWALLSPARRSNALRHWMRAQSGRGASAALVERLLRELQGTVPARWIDGSSEWRRYRGHLMHANVAAGTTTGEATEGPAGLQGVGAWNIPGWPGQLEVRRVDRGGLALDRLARLRVAPRRGGEQFQRAPRSLPRSLKKQFQAAGVPAWGREGPLLYDGEQLVFVPGLGIDARALAPAGEPQVALRWAATWSVRASARQDR